MSELVFEVTQESDGGYCAECLTESIFTQADTWEELRANVVEAVNAFYFDGHFAPQHKPTVRAKFAEAEVIHALPLMR